MNLNRISGEVVDAAITIHRELGPGLLESVYEIVLAQELKQRGFSVERQAPVSITYKEMHFEEGFRCDLLIENQVIVELKSVESLSKLHKKQLLTYLILSGRQLGLLLNFGESLMKDGIHRIVNSLDESKD
ncbi:MAG TPA: GxxExxY protein [Planctomycetaceae bacterium]|nr:GxxExxY protein [Planctomycetaceae bacterium]